MKTLKYCYYKLDENGKKIEGSEEQGAKPIRSSQSDSVAVDELLEDYGMAYAIPIVRQTGYGKMYMVGKSRLYILANRR